MKSAFQLKHTHLERAIDDAVSEAAVLQPTRGRETALRCLLEAAQCLVREDPHEDALALEAIGDALQSLGRQMSKKTINNKR